MARIARPPIIAVMGHIDHGKSSLLDYIRKTKVVENEAGGITQHVSAYVAEHKGRQVTFLDTPGHEAFEAIRLRGASAADIAILVVAADEGVMPQTKDALAAINEAKIPFIVAITKIDKNNADIERAKTSLLENEVYLEGLGGSVAYVPVSSKTGEGIPELLDLVLLAADLADITADLDISASGFVLESTQDPKRGLSATLIIRDGSIKTGEFAVAGDAYAPIRFIEDFRGVRVERAGPSEPARISGFNKLPAAGAQFNVVKNKKDAEVLAEKYKKAVVAAHDHIATDDGITELPLVIKTDAAGSADAIAHELARIKHERGMIRVVASSVGNVSENDVKTARAVNGVIIAFNVGTDSIASDLADRDHIRIFSFAIIYELSKKVAELLNEQVPSVEIERELGRSRVLKVFSTSGRKQVVGMRHLSGALAVGNKIKLMRRGEEIARGSILNLQVARADVKEIHTEGDFGAEFELRAEAVYGDEIIAFAVENT